MASFAVTLSSTLASMKHFPRSLSAFAAIALAGALFSAKSHAIDFTVDFDNPAGGVMPTPTAAWNGDPVNIEPVQYKGIGGTDLLVKFTAAGGRNLSIFDTADWSGNDDDLQTPHTGDGNNEGDWNAGYIFGDTDGAGKVLVVQENGVSEPDDEANGGEIVVDFINTTTVFDSFGILDLEGNQTLNVHFFDVNGNEFTSRMLSYPSVGDGYPEGDNSYFEVSGLGYDNVARVVFDSSTSYALSGIGASVVPEPTTIFGLGLAAAFALLRYRKNFRVTAK